MNTPLVAPTEPPVVVPNQTPVNRSPVTPRALMSTGSLLPLLQLHVTDAPIHTALPSVIAAVPMATPFVITVPPVMLTPA